MTEPSPTLRRLAEQERRITALEKRGGGGHDSGMDAWQTSVENRLASLDTRLGNLDHKVDRNFQITWAGIVGLGLLGVGGFAWIISLLMTMQNDIQRDIHAVALAITALTGQPPP